ncbi:hypothetical protein IHE44_0005073 [Lamprotornis superbus]|uniref:Ankyrin repeat and SOCS box protein 9 n=1 Tax=Lamprotornis superbus TaxID=245042 RepID=A0A835P049_9PASS|nr:hypothetical protein IHE44_0005073 [Lamprotornis superbus]
MGDERTNQNASKLQGAGGQACAASPSSPLMSDFVSDWSPLHEASIHGRLLSLKKLIEQAKSRKYFKSISGLSPVSHSLSGQKGNDVNLVTADQVSPLHEACLGGHAACASVLLKHGAQVNGVTVDWHTPLFNTCVSGSVACLNLLLEHGASLQPPCDLASPIHEAAKRGHVQCVELLASRGIDIDHNIKHLGTPLYVACENQQLNCAKKLLESGANVNSGKGLDSPLHMAARNCSVDLVKLLMDFGADVWVKNAENKRPVELVPPGCPVGQLFLQREGPLSLMQLCRLCIRRNRRKHMKNIIYQLGYWDIFVRDQTPSLFSHSIDRDLDDQNTVSLLQELPRKLQQSKTKSNVLNQVSQRDFMPDKQHLEQPPASLSLQGHGEGPHSPESPQLNSRKVGKLPGRDYPKKDGIILYMYNGQCSSKSAKAEDKAVSEGEAQSTGEEILSLDLEPEQQCYASTENNQSNNDKSSMRKQTQTACTVRALMKQMCEENHSPETLKILITEKQWDKAAPGMPLPQRMCEMEKDKANPISQPSSPLPSWLQDQQLSDWDENSEVDLYSPGEFEEPSHWEESIAKSFLKRRALLARSSPKGMNSKRPSNKWEHT